MCIKYQARSVSKFSEIDTWKEGCNPNTSSGGEINLYCSADSVPLLIAELKDYFGNDYVVDPCEDQSNRIDFQRLENAEGDEASKGQIQSWKMGKCTLWNSVYTVYVEQVSDDFEMVTE
jgi:hypothetical protein